MTVLLKLLSKFTKGISISWDIRTVEKALRNVVEYLKDRRRKENEQD